MEKLLSDLSIVLSRLLDYLTRGSRPLLQKFRVKRYSQAFTTTAAPLSGGDRVKVISATGPLNLYFKDANGKLLGEALDVEAGDSFDFERDFYFSDARSFAVLEVASVSGTSTAKIYICEGIKADSNQFAGNVSIVAAEDLAGSAVDVMADTDIVTIAAATRRDILLRSMQDSLGIIWVSEAGADLFGFPLYPGDWIVFENFIGEIQAYSDDANNLCALVVS